MSQGFVLVQDNNLKHISKGISKKKQEQHVLQLMSWPAQRTDLNSIDLRWDDLDRNVRPKQPTGATQLLQFLQESWAELSSVDLQSLVERMPRICEEVIAAK